MYVSKRQAHPARMAKAMTDSSVVSVMLILSASATACAPAAPITLQSSLCPHSERSPRGEEEEVRSATEKEKGKK